jgi:hypothetical protein
VRGALAAALSGVGGANPGDYVPVANRPTDEPTDDSIKVTDRRMFTAEGELREEYRFLEDAEQEQEPEPEPEPRPVAQPEPRPASGDAAPAAAAAPDDRDRRYEAAADSATGPDAAPRFYDLVAALAEPATIYLGDQPLPGGQRAENLELARFYIDLLDVLRQSTEGNLQAQEAAFLEDTLYQLRVRFVQKSG